MGVQYISETGPYLLVIMPLVAGYRLETRKTVRCPEKYFRCVS